MNYEDVNLLENGLKAMLEDEEKGIKEYEKRATDAADMGAFNTALMYRDIWKQEKEHAQKLRERIAEAELVKYGRVPGEDVGMVMEPHRNVRITHPHISITGDEMIAVSERRSGGYAGVRGRYSGVRQPVRRGRY